MKILKYKYQIVTTLIFILLTGCYEFDFVNQPYQADPNSFFDAQISVTNDYLGEDCSEVFFGILMPQGWITNDSVLYTQVSTNETTYIVYSDSISQQMAFIDPPPENYYWWVGMSDIIIDSDDTYVADLKIYTDGQTDTFFIDYMLGDDFNGLNYVRSNNHLIIVGDPIGCLPEGITFTTQEEVDNFEINYPGCSEIVGNMTISGDINNLAGLDILTSVGGNLKIEFTNQLEDLTGLDNLTFIGGALSIIDNNYLESLSGLYNLTSIGRELWMESNPYLLGLTAAGGLGDIGRNITIIDNNTLLFLIGLEGVTALGGSLRIENNESITNLNGLNNLTSIGSSLIISGNPDLNNISALGSLSTTLGWDLRIHHNSALNSLSALQGITAVGGDLSINDNDNLTSLSGLDNVTTIG